MKPSQLSAHLRRIAAAIDASKRPSRSRVAAELKKVVAGLHTASDSVSAAVAEAMAELKRQLPAYGETPDGTGPITVPIGSGSKLFPSMAALDESSWYIYWTGDSADPITVCGAVKRDVEVIAEFTHQTFLDPDPGMDIMGDVISAIVEDAQAMASA